MGIFSRTKSAASGFSSGDRYEGEVAWCQDYLLVPWSGYYAVDEDGPIADLRLKLVSDDPNDVHYEVY